MRNARARRAIGGQAAEINAEILGHRGIGTGRTFGTIRTIRILTLTAPNVLIFLTVP